MFAICGMKRICVIGWLLVSVKLQLTDVFKTCLRRSVILRWLDRTVVSGRLLYNMKMKFQLASLAVVPLFLAVGLQLTAAANQRPDGGEATLDGPGGLKVFLGRRGGAIRLFRELLRPNDGKLPEGGGKGEDGGKKRPPPRSGEIGVSLGRIQEVDSSSNSIGGNHGVPKPGDVDFSVTTQKYVHPTS